MVGDRSLPNIPGEPEVCHRSIPLDPPDGTWMDLVPLGEYGSESCIESRVHRKLASGGFLQKTKTSAKLQDF